MESHGEHKRDKALLVFWITIGLGIGFVIGASTHGPAPDKDPNGWVLGIASGLIMGVLMGLFATKKGLD